MMLTTHVFAGTIKVKFSELAHKWHDIFEEECGNKRNVPFSYEWLYAIAYFSKCFTSVVQWMPYMHTFLMPRNMFSCWPICITPEVLHARGAIHTGNWLPTHCLGNHRSSDATTFVSIKNSAGISWHAPMEKKVSLPFSAVSMHVRLFL